MWMFKTSALYKIVGFRSGNRHFSQDNATKTLIIIIIKKMNFSQQNKYPKVGNFQGELIDTQEWGEILKIDPKLGRLSSPSESLSAARPGSCGRESKWRGRRKIHRCFGGQLYTTVIRKSGNFKRKTLGKLTLRKIFCFYFHSNLSTTRVLSVVGIGFGRKCPCQVSHGGVSSYSKAM